MNHHHKRNTCPDCGISDTCRCMAPKVETKEYCKDCQGKRRVNEDAAAGSVSAGAVAGVRGRLFKGAKNLTRRVDPDAIPVIKPKKKVSEGARRSFSQYVAESDDFDSADIISKLSQNAKVADELDGSELAVFGMEDDDGAITKVYVPHDQAKDFERALADRLKDVKDSKTEDEIAAILFDLKDRFKIVDVKWPTIQEDEEQAPAAPAAPEGAVPPAPGADPTAAGAPVDPAAPGDPSADPMGGDVPPGGDVGADGAASPDQGDMITQILDMLRQDAEARKADAEAKIADAKAREADAAQRTAAVKLQGEEEVVDAEAYFKEKKEQKKEADRIKMLARYRQENKMGEDGEDAPQPSGDASDDSDEDEEMTVTRKTLLKILRGGV